MAIWVVRAGKQGERENLALDEGRVCIGWNQLDDLSSINTREEIRDLLEEKHPDRNFHTVINHAGQLFKFVREIQIGDIIAMPLKKRHAIAFGDVIGDYEYVASNPEGARHSRRVKWNGAPIPRDAFDPDVLKFFDIPPAIFRVNESREEIIGAVLKRKLPPKAPIKTNPETIKSNLIAGEWSSGEGEIENRNPSDVSDLIGMFAQASPDQLDATLEQARSAQAQWRSYGLERKQSVLMAIGNEMMDRAEELGRLLSREEGKPLAEGKGEVFRAGQFFTYYAAECLRQIGENADSVRDGIEIDVRREPVGTVAVISPWNFPTATASWKIAPALAYGNAVVWKPANATPASAVALTEIIERQDIPKGLFSLVMGSGSSIGQRLVESDKVDAISFTGSLAVGKGIAAAAIGNLTKLQMEMGSKNALAVMDDADIELAVTLALGGAFGGSGQKCTASSRLVVHKDIHDAFVEKLVAGAKIIKVGHALEEGTQMGPVVSEQQLRDNLAYVETGKSEGAELACGGKRLNMPHEGFYMSPGVFVNTRNDMRINREEMFAPLTCVIKVDGYDEALETVNDTGFGLTSGIVTKSLARATHFRQNVRTGVVAVNLPTAGTDYHVPFGGRGDSSYGPREQGKAAAEFYTIVKTSYISAGKPD